MHSVTRLTTIVLVPKSLQTDISEDLDRPWIARKWNVSHSNPSILSQKLRMRNYAHFEQYWFSWSVIFGFYNEIWRFFIRFNQQFWRALIWQKISWKQQQTKTGKSETGRKDCHEDENVGVVKLSTFVEFFRPCQANSVLLKPLKAVQRPLETFDCFMISMAKWNWAPNGIHCYLLTGCD